MEQITISYISFSIHFSDRDMLRKKLLNNISHASRNVDNFIYKTFSYNMVIRKQKTCSLMYTGFVKKKNKNKRGLSIHGHNTQKNAK